MDADWEVMCITLVKGFFSSVSALVSLVGGRKMRCFVSKMSMRTVCELYYSDDDSICLKKDAFIEKKFFSEEPSFFKRHRLVA